MNRRTVTGAGPGVHVDDADVRPERIGEVRRVVDRRCVQVAFDTVGQLERAVGEHGYLRDRLALLRVALDEPPAELPLQVIGAHSKAAAAIDRALSLTLLDTIAAAAPDTGVEREPYVPRPKGVLSVSPWMTSMSSGGIPSSWLTICAKVVS